MDLDAWIHDWCAKVRRHHDDAVNERLRRVSAKASEVAAAMRTVADAAAEVGRAMEGFIRATRTRTPIDPSDG